MSFWNHGGGEGFGGGGGAAPPRPGATTAPDPDGVPSSSSLLESKVQEMAASLRAERDKARRSQLLSAERHRLTQDEVQAATNTLESMQHKLADLEDGMRVRNEVDQLQREVQNLKEQVAFQHGELVALMEQRMQQEAAHAHADQHRHNTFAQLRDVVVERRVRKQQQEGRGGLKDGDDFTGTALPPGPEEFESAFDLRTAIEDLQGELTYDPTIEDERWTSGLWLDLVLSKAQDAEDAAHQWDKATDKIRHVLEAYRHHFPEILLGPSTNQAGDPAHRGDVNEIDSHGGGVATSPRPDGGAGAAEALLLLHGGLVAYDSYERVDRLLDIDDGKDGEEEEAAYDGYAAYMDTGRYDTEDAAGLEATDGFHAPHQATYLDHQDGGMADEGTGEDEQETAPADRVPGAGETHHDFDYDGDAPMEVDEEAATDMPPSPSSGP